MIAVLLVDDHEVVRTGLRLLLQQQADIRVVGDVATPEAAATALEAGPVDVCILDVTLGSADGIAFADLMRRRWPATKIVALTMHNDPPTVRQALRAGAIGYVVKGSSAEDLLRAIRGAAAGRGYVDPSVAHVVMADAVRGAAVDPLTPREEEVVRHLAAGRTTKECAAALGLSEHTVNRHVANAMRRLGVHDRAELVRLARER